MSSSGEISFAQHSVLEFQTSMHLNEMKITLFANIFRYLLQKFSFSFVLLVEILVFISFSFFVTVILVLVF